ncbi:hypothetical protein [Prauserella flavalba]|uniref:hypothetical protein n=1 Tax=Prauserella flavalba TaxID=1477506 RepID=UPI0011B59E77|nr:hypothetical protein [Prauserella flavalba]
MLVESVRIEKPGNERSERAARKEAEKALTKLQGEADELKVARTKSTFGALLDRWLAAGPGGHGCVTWGGGREQG